MATARGDRLTITIMRLARTSAWPCALVVATPIIAACASSREPVAITTPFAEAVTQPASGPATAAVTAPATQPSNDAHHAAAPTASVANQPEHTVAATAIFSLAPGEMTFASLDKDGRPEGTIVIRASETDEHDAQVAVADGDRRVEFLTQGEDGSIVLTAVIERADNALTLFDPPLIVAPAVLRMGETFESAATMRVVALDNPKNQRGHGRAKRTITYSGDALVALVTGKTPAAKLEIAFEADLRLADALERTTLYVSRERGLIARASVEKITILGAIPRTTRRTLLREP